VSLKRIKGQPTDRITLRDTRDFHNSFFMKTDKFPLNIDATDRKRDKLVSEWGPILGLTKENTNEWILDVKPEVQDGFRSDVKKI